MFPSVTDAWRFVRSIPFASPPWAYGTTSLRSPTPSAYGTTLIEQLAHHLREGSTNSDVSRQSNSQLVAMAADPEVQAELQKIDHEFGVTEVDGLEFE